MNWSGNPLGLIYTLNFSQSFNMSQNISALLGTLSKGFNGGAANNIAPNMLDGAMLANDDEFFLYGGLQRYTSASQPGPANQIIAYEADQYGPFKESWRPGFLFHTLPPNVSDYTAYGGAVSAPSENKAWYFSGMQAQSGGPTFQVNGNDSLTAYNLSSSLITLDMSNQRGETWSNTSLPSNVSARAGAQVVWVPVGSQGILVVLGGVIYPDWINADLLSNNPGQSVRATS
jgi:hypothetical protein